MSLKLIRFRLWIVFVWRWSCVKSARSALLCFLAFLGGWETVFTRQKRERGGFFCFFFAVLPSLGVSAVRSRWLCWKSSWWFPATTTRWHSNTLFRLKRSSVPSHLDRFTIIIQTTSVGMELGDACATLPRCGRDCVDCLFFFLFFSAKKTPT